MKNRENGIYYVTDTTINFIGTSGVTVNNSTISNNVKCGILHNAPALNLYLNNTIVTQISDAVSIATTSSSLPVYGYNNLTTFTDWTDGTGNLVYDSGKPLFFDAANGNYHLADNSQAIDKGSNIRISAGVIYDRDGNDRIVNGIVDIGAYEHDGITLKTDLVSPVVTATSGSNTSITTTWNTVANASGYRIECATDVGFTKNVKTKNVASNEKNIDFIGLNTGTMYYVRVMALGTGDYNDSGWSNIDNVTPVATRLSAPMIGYVLGLDGEIIVTWSTILNADRYVVEYAMTDSFTNAHSVSSTDGWALLTDIDANKTYYFRVMAIGTGAYCNSDWSLEASAMTPAIVLLAPTLQDVVATGSTTINVAWDVVPNANGYIVEFATDDSFADAETVSATDTSTTLPDLMANTTYYVRVMATGTGAYSNSNYSNEKSATTQKNVIGDSLVPPASFTSREQTPTTITLAWDAQSGVTEYILEYKKTSNAKWTTLTAPAADATIATVTGLTADTEYEFRLTAVNGDDSETSTINNVSTTIPETIPSVKTVAKASGVKKEISLSTVTLTWKQNTAKNTHYKVTCATSGVEIGEITVVDGRYSVTITGLSPQKNYKFEIVAFNGETAAKVTKVSVKTKTYAAVSKVAKTISGTTVNWTWADHKLKFPETTHYELLDASGTTVVETVTTNAVSKDLTSGTHKYSIRAVVKDAEGNILFASKVKKLSVKIK